MAAKTGLESLVLTRKHGKDLSVTMGGLLFKDLITCFEELVANSYDADAEKVNIIYDPRAELLVFEDDGTGMDGEGLKSFYRMGESLKRKQSVTEKGRRSIGKFGIASLALRTLAVTYTLETWRDGIHYSIRETFSGDDTDDKPINAESKKINNSNHGTKITINGLKFAREGRSVDPGLLMERFRGSRILLMPDFSLYFNNSRIQPRSIENGIEYSAEMDDSEIGKVSGSLWYSSQVLDEGVAGVYINVNGRPVGGRNFDLLSGNISLTKRVYGVVNADGLSEIVGFDRDNFLRDHPKVRTLSNHILNLLKQIRQDMEVDIKLRDKTKAKKLVETVSPEVGSFIGNHLDEDKYKIEFNAEKAGEIAKLDKRNNTLYVNPSSPSFALEKLNISGLRIALYNAAKYVIASSMMQPNKINDFLALEKRIVSILGEDARRQGKLITLADIIADREGDVKTINRISPARLYDYTEVSKLFNFDNALLKRMAASGLLTDKMGRFCGQDVINISDKMKGHVTIFDAVRKAYPEPTHTASVFYHNKEEATVAKLDAIAGAEGQLPKYVVNLTTEGKSSFYVVRESDFDSFKRFLDTWRFPGQGMIGNKLYYYRQIGKAGKKPQGIVISLLEIKGKDDFEIIRETVGREFEFVANGSRLPDGVSTRSFFSMWGDTDFVVSVYAGNVENLHPKFAKNNFKYVNVKGRAPDVLYKGSVYLAEEKGTKSLPLTKMAHFTSPVIQILSEMYGK